MIISSVRGFRSYRAAVVHAIPCARSENLGKMQERAIRWIARSSRLAQAPQGREGSGCPYGFTSISLAAFRWRSLAARM